MDECPVQGESQSLIRLTVRKPEISADLAGGRFNLDDLKCSVNTFVSGGIT